MRKNHTSTNHLVGLVGKKSHCIRTGAIVISYWYLLYWKIKCCLWLYWKKKIPRKVAEESGLPLRFARLSVSGAEKTATLRSQIIGGEMRTGASAHHLHAAVIEPHPTSWLNPDGSKQSYGRISLTYCDMSRSLGTSSTNWLLDNTPVVLKKKKDKDIIIKKHYFYNLLL